LGSPAEVLQAAARAPHDIAFYKAGSQHGLRDVREAPGGGVRNVVYHLGVYLGRCDLALEDFHPQREEIVGLRYALPAEVDALLLEGALAPNMAFLWLTYARRLFELAPRPAV